MARDSLDPGTFELPGIGTRVGYARVSTEGQDFALQEDALKTAGCQHIVVERVARSGPRRAKSGSPELDAMLRHIRPGDTLVVWRLDRLAGSLVELVRVLDSLRDRGAHFESLTERIETATAAGRALFQMIGVFAEYERNLLIERTRAGVAAARARGRIGGRPPALDAKEERQLAAMLRDETISRASICKSFNISRTTLYAYRSKFLAAQEKNP